MTTKMSKFEQFAKQGIVNAIYKTIADRDREDWLREAIGTIDGDTNRDLDDYDRKITNSRHCQMPNNKHSYRLPLLPFLNS